ncbi:transposase [Streptomyces sp. SID8385]|uniref:transposase n=1 Tax=Streptomyces sp. SID8385 TaxID=2690364 RepID=UPI001361CD82|nr:transposase [Streptomyces sp. SID8385]
MVDTLMLDLLAPEGARGRPMTMKNYSDKFKADAVALRESTPTATYKSVAASLGINRNTLRNWVPRSKELRSGVPGARDARTAVRATQATPAAEPDERIRQLEARGTEVEGSERKLATERDILRKAAKYFAGKTNWCAASSSSMTTGTPSR